MKALFVHNNFPAQFIHLAPLMAARGDEIWAIGGPTARALPGVNLAQYKLPRGSTQGIFHTAARFESDGIRGVSAMEAAAAIAKRGFTPDFIFGHFGWGETQFLDAIWPRARSLVYAEFFTRPVGFDVGFDPEFPGVDAAGFARVRSKTASLAMALLFADAGVSPTHFQRSSFPPELQAKIEVIHDGVDVEAARPRADATFELPNGQVLRVGDEVVTNLNRNLEPLRGLHIFLRALPAILKARPNAQIVIVGDEKGTTYGLSHPKGTTWQAHYLKEIEGKCDLSRVHFLGKIDRQRYLDLLAVSAAHVYLTYPFVLSWSLIEAMSAGCAIIASDTAPVREAIAHNESGLLFDFFDVAALSQSVIDALAKPEKMSPLRAAARAHAVATYDVRACVPRMLALVDKVAAGEKVSHPPGPVVWTPPRAGPPAPVAPKPNRRQRRAAGRP
jgi:glycosyltransferase involved in cell wall biosynthesis